MTEAAAAVQGNTESAGDTGVYSDSAGGGVEAPLAAAQQQTDPGVEAATKTAVETPAEQPIDYKFTYPKGVTPDQKALDAFIPVMQELKIPQEQAQKIINIQSNIARQSQVAYKHSVEKARNQWVNQITSDPEFGGENLKKNLQIANQGLDKVATEGFRNLLQKTGLGDHPEVIRVFHAIGKALGDDEFVPGGKAAKGIGNFYENSPDLK